MAAETSEHGVSADVLRLSEFQCICCTSNNTGNYQNDATERYALQLCFVISSACIALLCLDNVVFTTLQLLSANIPYFHFNCLFHNRQLNCSSVCLHFIYSAIHVFQKKKNKRFVSCSFFFSQFVILTTSTRVLGKMVVDYLITEFPAMRAIRRFLGVYASVGSAY
jgi:hypothetical protein